MDITILHLPDSVGLTAISSITICNTVYGKMFKGELSLNRESFPMNYGLVHWQYKYTSIIARIFQTFHSKHKSFPPQIFCCIWHYSILNQLNKISWSTTECSWVCVIEYVLYKMCTYICHFCTILLPTVYKIQYNMYM